MGLRLGARDLGPGRAYELRASGAQGFGFWLRFQVRGERFRVRRAYELRASRAEGLRFRLRFKLGARDLGPGRAYELRTSRA